ncbi:MAG: multicopper oxidase domain-containing protein [Gemmatimonadota bacterium]|jgi:FtsP/CotA-like multicopper oxidase with cupredoxin domain|nr:multicopper oxidase domain-containing protein [Gemmatimonadota bacterium]
MLEEGMMDEQNGTTPQVENTSGEGHKQGASVNREVQLTRRELLKVGMLGTAGLAAAGGSLAFRPQLPHELPPGASRVAPPRPGGFAHGEHSSHENMMAVGDFQPGGFDPTAFLTHFDTGKVSRLPSGQTLREYQMIAIDKEIEVAPGVFFPAWTYNSQVPGPTLRCTEGDRVRVRFINGGSHPHTVHFHGIHAANMDGSFEIIQPGGTFTYEFDAEPFGLHLYHCHAVPLKRHIHKGLYGVFIVDPKEGRPPAREMVMMMNAFDTNFDGENEIYAVNTAAFHYQKHPIPIRVGELVRVYLVNITEFDLINSLHLHGNFFRLYRTGTRLDHHEFTDTVMLCQGERAVLELTYKFPGKFMFHAHQSEFAELGWVGIFDVQGAPNA